MSPYVELDKKGPDDKTIREPLVATKHEPNSKSFPALLASVILHDPCFKNMHPKEVADELGPVCSSRHHQKVLEENNSELTFTPK
ncbi:hypothetical protein M1545_03275 [Patescibacteria group bacterium]|nr:hypothetical protein [Patescibacteria group bacterium]